MLKKYFPFAASLPSQMVGFHKELWLYGTITPARKSNDPQFMSENDCFSGLPDGGVLQVLSSKVLLWLSGAVTPARCPEESDKSLKMRTLDILKRYRHQNGLVLLLLLV